MPNPNPEPEDAGDDAGDEGIDPDALAAYEAIAAAAAASLTEEH